METILSSFLIICLIFLIVLSVFIVWINLPGTFFFLVVLSLISIFDNFETLSFNILIISLLIFIFLEIIEFLLTMITVKLYGGKSSSSFLSIIGGFVGALILNFILPILGAFIGLIVGSYTTVYFIEKKSGKTKKEAMRIANGTIIGYIISKGFKTCGIIFLGIYIFNIIS